MPKTEFQLEEEIKGEFRKTQPKATIVRDTFDSIFRTGKIEVQTPADEIKKTKFKQIKYHDSNNERLTRYQEFKNPQASQEKSKEELRQ